MSFSHQVLFSSEISRCQLMAYVQNLKNGNIIEQISAEIKKANQNLHKMIHLGSYEEQIFFENYQTLISILYESQPQVASNLALHRINIYAQRLIEANNPNKAKRVLQSVFLYLHKNDIDPLLLSTALNNLSYLYFFQKDYQLSFNTTMQNISFCQQSIKRLENQKNKKLKNYIQSLAVVLINSLKLGKQILTFCLKQNLFDVLQSSLVSLAQQTQQKQLEEKFHLQKPHQNLKQLKKLLNELGYEACIQYLGKESYFSRFFNKDKIQKKKLKEIQVQTDNGESIVFVNRNQFNIFQSQTLKKLDNIHEILKMNSVQNSQLKQSKKQEQNRVFLSTKNSQENIDYWDQNSQNKNQQNIDVKSPQKSYFYKIQRKENNQVNLFTDEKADEIQQFETDGWYVQAKLFITSDQALGRICLKCKNIKSGESFIETINQRDLLKILKLRSLQDNLPYEYLSSEFSLNFIQVCIKPYLLIKPEGRNIHLPRARTLTQSPIKLKFLSSECFIFFFHIRANSFRIAISPIEESGSIYLNVQLSQKSLQQLFEELFDPMPQKIRCLFQDQLKKNNKKVNLSKITKKSLFIKSLQKLETTILSIVKGFQHFLSNEEDSMESNDILGCIQKDEYYWKFNQIELNKSGYFLRVKFNKYKKAFSIYGQQFYYQNKQRNTLSRKGIFELKSHQFRQVFGFEPQYDFIKQKIKRIEEILSYKYTLKRNSDKSKFNVLMQNSQSTLRDTNFLVQRSFNQQSFYVDFVFNQQDSSYLCLLTLSVVTLSNIFPVGIKITLYDPNKVSTKAFFINIFSQNWNYQSFSQQKGSIYNCQSTQILSRTQVMFKPLVQKYPQQQNYFLTFWLKNRGFINILTKVLNQNHCLYMQKNLNSIVNWEKIFQE